MCFYVDSNYLMIKLQRNLCAPTCPTVTTFELRDYGKMPYVLRVFTALSAKKIKVGLVILHLFNIYIYIYYNSLSPRLRYHQTSHPVISYLCLSGHLRV